MGGKERGWKEEGGTEEQSTSDYACKWPTQIGRTYRTPQLFLQLFFAPSSGWMGWTTANSPVILGLSWFQVSSHVSTQPWMLPPPFYTPSLFYHEDPCAPGLGGVPFQCPPQLPVLMPVGALPMCVTPCSVTCLPQQIVDSIGTGLCRFCCCVPKYTKCSACSRC